MGGSSPRDAAADAAAPRHAAMQRPAAAAAAAAAAAERAAATARAEQARTSAATDDDSAAHVHGRGIMIRVVVALLVVFAIFHLSMWKVVYDLSADRSDSAKLRGASSRSWDALKGVLDHL